MAWLDCADVESTMASLSPALGVSTSALLSALESYDETHFDDMSEDPFRRMPREVLSEFGTSISRMSEAFVGASYFHGTRSAHPHAFAAQGILPLRDALDAIWSHLRVLAGVDISDSGWASFRESLALDAGDHSGFLYRHKTADRALWGPYAMLIREALLYPNEAGVHDYLNGPEIIEDIARAIEMEYRIPLLDRYIGATRPCIVKFHMPSLGTTEIQSAIWYLYSRIRNQPLTNVSQGGFSGNGNPVPSNSIVGVEVIH